MVFTVFDIVLQCFLSMIACIGYAIICNAPRREMPYCGLNGFFGWLVYIVIFKAYPHAVTATIIATMAVTALARFLSYHREAPSILYHIPGVMPLVPGAAVYHTITSGISGEIMATYSYALAGIKLSGAIGVGSLLILVLPYRLFSVIPKRKHKQP